ncbi:hypothetical protein NPIL_10602 [Nephila pilipes]|uniref:Uncharacterized protein n=1 Tax=Nephila pilipes TaxID=299642 RepID=A0A8X6P2J6_NEPPI|nr:hypothetical protein NPIL_10602 [Nephila pilipes]
MIVRRVYRQLEVITNVSILGLRTAGCFFHRITAETCLHPFNIQRMERKWFEARNVARAKDIGASRKGSESHNPWSYQKDSSDKICPDRQWVFRTCVPSFKLEIALLILEPQLKVTMREETMIFYAIVLVAKNRGLEMFKRIKLVLRFHLESTKKLLSHLELNSM